MKPSNAGKVRASEASGVERRIRREQNRVTFAEFVFLCAEDKALVAEFDRLTGFNLSRNGTGLDLMIDRATGREAAGIEQFVAFVHEFVWVPVTGNA